MSKITLTNLVNLQNETTAVNAINANNTVLTTALDNTLSRDGTTPNTMSASLDMNSNQILNVPAPVTASSPLRLSDLNSFVGGGTVTNIPAGGTTGQVLAKVNNTNYNVAWTSESATLTAGTNIALTGTTPTTISTITNPVFTTVTTPTLTNTGVLTLPTSTDNLVGRATTDTLTNKTLDTAGAGNSLKINGTGITAVTGSGSVVLGTAPTITTPVISSITNTGTLTLPTSTDTLIGKATTDTLTNKTLDTAGAGNVLKINGTTVSAVTGTGSVALATSPAFTTPAIGAATGQSLTLTAGDLIFATSGRGHQGTLTNDGAATGNVGEYQSSTVVSGSAITLSTGATSNVTSLALTAGDWDIYGGVVFLNGATTNLTFMNAGLTTTTATLPTVDGMTATQWSNSAGQVIGSGGYSIPMVRARFSLASTTIVYLVAQSTFTVSTSKAYGMMQCRRVR